MPEARAAIALPAHRPPARQDDAPAHGFANAILLAIPLWGLIGVALWAVL